MSRCAYALVAALGLVLAGGCARPYPPPGGDPDELPPGLVGTDPAPLAVIEPTTDPVVFEFDERLSERGFSEALVIVSPLDGALRVERDSRAVRVAIDGGWRADRVYRIVLLPGLRDLFGNVRDDAIELVFSTGPPVPPTAFGGLVLDRLTGRPVPTGVVTALRRADSAAYMAVADTGGFFALRHLPAGVYDVRAWADDNRNRRREQGEPVDSGNVVSLVDTATAVYRVFAPDTTGPRVTDATVLDSLHVRVTIDDYIDADASLDEAGATVFVLPDSVQYTTAVRVLTAPAYERLAAEQRAARDSAAAAARDSAAAAGDTAGVAADTSAAAVERARAAAAAAGVGARRGARPAAPAAITTQDIVIVLARPLAPGSSYFVSISGITNVSGLTGGGTAEFETPEPAEPPAAAPDTSSFRFSR